MRAVSEQDCQLIAITIERALGYLNAIGIIAADLDISPGCPGIEACVWGADKELCELRDLLESYGLKQEEARS